VTILKDICWEVRLGEGRGMMCSRVVVVLIEVQYTECSAMEWSEGKGKEGKGSDHRFDAVYVVRAEVGKRSHSYRCRSSGVK
jgi:hypothetical protein